MAATQRPISALGFGEPTTAPAWKSLPSWAVIPTGDKADGSDVLRTMAARAGATVTERSEEHTSELQSRQYLVCRLLLEKKKKSQPTALNTFTATNLYMNKYREP